MATIIIRNSTGSGAVPSSLVQGELAINTVDGKLFYGSGSGNIVKEFTASNSLTASYLNTLNQDLTFNGNLTLNGTASISTLVVNQTQYSSGSNQLGDAANDTQTLFGSVIIPTGSLTVSGSTIISSSNATQLSVSNNALFVSSSGRIGFNISSSLGAQATFNNRSTELGFSILSEINTYANGGYGFRTNGASKAASFYLYNSTGNIYNFNGASLIFFDASNNVGIGVSSSLSSKVHVRGSGTTSGTTALRVENANTSASLIVRDDGYVGINTGSADYNLEVNGTARVVNTLIANAGVRVGGASGVGGVYVQAGSTLNQETIALRGSLLPTDIGNDIILSSGQGNAANTTSIKTLVRFAGGFVPTSGTGGYTVALINPTINQTGGANGITRGLYIQPTLTSAADFRAIETTSGSVIFNHGATPLMFISSSGNVGIGTSTPAYKLDVSGSARFKFTPAGTDLFTIDSATTTRYFIVENSNGFVGIGNGYTTSTTPATSVDIRGNTSIRGGSATVGNAFIVTNSTPTTLLTVQNNGLVGIGTSTPSASLHVAGTTRLSGSFNTAASGSILTIIGSGSTQPIFTVQGSQGELFSITDSLTGSLFSVNDISGLPILEVFSDNTTLIGDYQDPMLITTKKVTMTNSGSFVVYSLPTASYDTAFFDYSIKSGSNARAGQIMAIQSGASVNFTETTTTDFGSTTAVSFTVLVSGSNMVLTGSAATGSWTIKTIVRGI